jgi:hypothetical protein
VYCRAGRSRSVSIVIGYLISIGYTLDAAYKLVQDKRKNICPNIGFMASLKKLEMKMQNQINKK